MKLLMSCLEFVGHELVDEARFRECFNAALRALPGTTRAALESRWRVEPLSAVTIVDGKSAAKIIVGGNMDSPEDMPLSTATARGACISFQSWAINAMTDEELETFIAATLCEAVLSLMNGVVDQDEADEMARTCGYDPSILDAIDFQERLPQ